MHPRGKDLTFLHFVSRENKMKCMCGNTLSGFTLYRLTIPVLVSSYFYIRQIKVPCVAWS